MTLRTRFGIAAGIIVVAAVAVILLPRDTTREISTLDPPTQTAETLHDAAPNPVLPVAETSSESAIPETQPEVTSAARPKTGPGRIYGKAILPEDVPKSPIRVELHRVDVESLLVSYEDTLVASADAGADGEFSFDRLPLGTYQLYATTSTHVAQNTARLIRNNPETQVSLRLYPGGVISGRVVDENRDPVAGAQVFVAAYDIGGQKQSTSRARALSSRVVTDSDGLFTMSHLRLSTNDEPGYRLAVKADGFATFQSDYIKAGTANAEFVLGEGAILSGSLTKDGTAEPVPDQTVLLESELTFERLAGITDAEGFFFIPNVSSGNQIATLVDSEFVIVPESGIFEVPKDAAAVEAALLARMGGSISGRVYDADSNAGMPDIDVHAYTDQRERHKATTGRDGTYRIGGLSPKAHNVSIVYPSGYTISESHGFGFAMLTPESGSELKGVDFALTHGMLVSGVVVDDEGKPIPAANVSGTDDDGSEVSRAKTDNSGAFTLSGFRADSTISLHANKDGFALPRTTPDERRRTYELKQNLSGITLVLVPGATVSGIVVDSRGVPVPAKYMSMQTAADPPSHVAMAVSGPAGEVTFERIPPGEYLIGLRYSNTLRVHDESTAHRIAVARGQSISGLRFVVEVTEGEHSISGRVVDTRGNPVPRADITVIGIDHVYTPRGRSTTSDANGAFLVSGLEGGAHEIRVHASGFPGSERLPVTASTTNLVITLKDFGRIEGRVVNEHTGQPIPMFTLDPNGADKHVRDPQGRFVLEEIEESTAALSVVAEGFAPAVVPLPAVVPGQTQRDIIVRLTPGAELTGVVRDRAGQPVSSAWVYVSQPNNRGPALHHVRATTGPDGAFQLASLPAGTLELSVSHRGFAPARQPVTIAYGARNHAEVTLSAGAAITGVVTLNGKPAANAQMYADVARRGGGQAHTDAQGRYTIERLNAGQARIQVSHGDDGRSHSKTVFVAVSDGTVTEMNIELSAGTATLEGTIFSTPGIPEKSRLNVYVSWGENTGGSVSAQTDRNGNYLMEGLPAGEASVHVSMDGRMPKVVPVQLIAGQRTRRDIVLSAGTTLHVEVTGAAASRNFPIYAILLQGHVSFSALPENSLNHPLRVTFQELRGTQCKMPALEPGPYTLLVIEYDNAAAQLGKDSVRRWTSVIVDVTEQPEQTVQVPL